MSANAWDNDYVPRVKAKAYGYPRKNDEIDEEVDDEIVTDDKEVEEVIIDLEDDTTAATEEDPIKDDELEVPVDDIEEDVLQEIEKNNEDVLRMIQDDSMSDEDREEMMNDLAIKNIKTVYYVVNKFTAYSVTQDDLISAGMLGYAKALKKFNPNRGVKFSTFAINCIKNEIRFCLRKENRHYKNHISLSTVKYEDKNGGQVVLEDVIADKKLTPEEELQKKSLRQIIVSIIDTLSPIEKYIIIYRFGLDRELELTQKEIAEQVDMSQANVSKIERGCMDKIRELYLHDLNV